VKALEDLKNTVARLREPGGCPWDQEQTHKSLLPCLIEECSEVIEAVDYSDYESLREELGDLLLSIFMHARIAEESGLFDLQQVACDINEKLIRRHPHVFGSEAGNMSTEEVLLQWDHIKKAEKKAKGGEQVESVFKKLPPRLPATYYAQETCKRMRKHGVRVEEHVHSPKDIPQGENEMAHLLMACLAKCQEEGWDPEKLIRTRTDAMITAVDPLFTLNQT